MSQDDTSLVESLTDSRPMEYVQTRFPWAYDRKVAAGLVALLVLASVATFVGLGMWTGDVNVGPGFDEHPPGTNESGVTDSDLLVEQHAIGVAASDYRVNINLTSEQGNKTQQEQRTYEQDVESGALSGHIESAQITYDVYNSPDQNATYYRATQMGENSTVQYQKQTENRETEFTGRDFLKQRFQLFETESQGYTELDDGTVVREFTILGLNEQATENMGNASISVEGSFAITEDGVILEYNATIRRAGSEQTPEIVQHESLAVSHPSLTIEDPDWLDAAINETATEPEPATEP